ncbi:MAG: WG repeat-containing protein, partial [Flammeovirgaceae bacterium]
EADVLITSEGLIARNGKRISLVSKVMEPIGLGFWKVGDSTCMHLLHASGKIIISNGANSVQLIGNRFLWIKGGASAGIYSLAGKLLLKGSWHAVDWLKNVLVLTQLEKKTIVTIEDIRHLAQGISFTPQHVYDEVKVAANNSLLVRNGSLEGILDFKGRFIVPLARQVLALEPFGLVRKTEDNFFFDEIDKQLADKEVKRYKHYGNWLSLVTTQGVEVWDIRKKKFLPKVDSCWFAAGLLFTKNAEATSIYFNSTTSLSFKNEQKVTLVKSRDSIRAFFTNEGKQRKTVYAIATGAKLFASNFDELESIDETHFLLTLKNKKGIITSQGKIILPIEYDLLALNQRFYWSIFKDKKFGLINLATGSSLKPLSTRNVIILNDEYLAIFNNDKYGFVNWQGKPLTKLEYDDILPWNDHSIWVKKSFTWSLINLKSNNILIGAIKKFDKWIDLQKDKLYRIQKNDLYGIITAEKGVVIPPQFSFIKNVGSSEKPLYFTDKEVEEAGVHVVIYYDSDGKLIRKQVYEEEEFESLACEID